MFYYIAEFFVIGAISVSMFGFNTNAKIALCLYYGRKAILALVKSKII